MRNIENGRSCYCACHHIRCERVCAAQPPTEAVASFALAAQLSGGNADWQRWLVPLAGDVGNKKQGAGQWVEPYKLETRWTEAIDIEWTIPIKLRPDIQHMYTGCKQAHEIIKFQWRDH